MKKILINIIIILVIVSSMFILKGVEAKEANTINELKQELSSLQAEKAANDKAKQQTQSQIDSNKNAIYNAYQEREANQGKVTEAENKIAESEIKIEEKNQETNDLISFYQISNGENAYLEYVSGAKSTTDLVMRSAIVEQLSEYNKKVLEELNALVEENKQLKIDLIARNEELVQKEKEYESAISSLGNKISELNEINADYSDQIKMKKELIKYYQSVCKSDDEALSSCVGAYNDYSFLRPVEKGYVSSSWGYRNHPIKGVYKFHNAIDISGSGFEGTPVYAAANGMVAGITVRASCGGNSVYIHHIVNGKYYTTQYMHLLSYNVKVGDVVTKYTKIGLAGGGSTSTSRGGYDSCTTGAHLHFGISTGHYLGSGSNGYTTWSRFLANSINPLGLMPSSATTWKSRG